MSLTASEYYEEAHAKRIQFKRGVWREHPSKNKQHLSNVSTQYCILLHKLTKLKMEGTINVLFSRTKLMEH